MNSQQGNKHVQPDYGEQFTAFIDFLGFKEANKQADSSIRLNVLALLLSLSALRGEFEVTSTTHETGTTHFIKPAITTFSDHIVISYPLKQIAADRTLSEDIIPFVVLHQFHNLLSRIAAAALRIGFLLRGGATIGDLYHAGGVVFGEAMVEAFELESRTSVYPRVTLSAKIVSRPKWISNKMWTIKDDDGIYHIDYFRTLLLDSAPAGSSYLTAVKDWLRDVNAIIFRNLTRLESEGKLNELAKWAWFARKFRASLEMLNPELMKSMGISLDEVPSL